MEAGNIASAVIYVSLSDYCYNCYFNFHVNRQPMRILRFNKVNMYFSQHVACSRCEG